MMYKVCEYCGAHLDCGEICECRSETEYGANTEKTEESQDKKEPAAI